MCKTSTYRIAEMRQRMHCRTKCGLDAIVLVCENCIEIKDHIKEVK